MILLLNCRYGLVWSPWVRLSSKDGNEEVVTHRLQLEAGEAVSGITSMCGDQSGRVFSLGASVTRTPPESGRAEGAREWGPHGDQQRFGGRSMRGSPGPSRRLTHLSGDSGSLALCFHWTKLQ